MFSARQEALRLVLISLLLACWLPLEGAAQDQGPSGSPTKADAIRIRREWFYNQRAYPHKHIARGVRLKALEQLRAIEQQKGRRAAETTQRTFSVSSFLSSRSSTRTTTAGQTSATALSSTQWTLIGPQPTSTQSAFNPVSGRVTAMAVDPTNPDVVYLGATEGGVWKTTDGGSTWTPLTDNQASLAVGSIAIDLSNPQIIYVGVGEENFNGDAYFGAGILKSTDGGSTWTQIAARRRLRLAFRGWRLDLVGR